MTASAILIRPEWFARPPSPWCARSSPISGHAARIFDEHAPEIARFLHRATGSAHTAEDLLSDVFLEVVRSLPRFRDRGQGVRPWLYRIALNRLRDWRRRQNRRRRRVASLRPAAPIADDPSAAHSGATDLRAAFACLSSTHQDALLLVCVHELPITEAACVLGCAEGTVKSRVHRAKAALRALLEEQGHARPTRPKGARP